MEKRFLKERKVEDGRNVEFKVYRERTFSSYLRISRTRTTKESKFIYDGKQTTEDIIENIKSGDYEYKTVMSDWSVGAVVEYQDIDGLEYLITDDSGTKSDNINDLPTYE